MKKLISNLIVAVSLLTAGQASASSEIQVKVDGTTVAFPDTKPFISEGRTMVPVRFVSEALGAQVSWEEATKTVQLQRNGIPIALRIGEKKAVVNNKTVTFDAAAQLKGNRTFVPLRFISEAYGAIVNWSSSEKMVLITTTPAVIKDTTGYDFPVNEDDRTFQSFHKSLKIKNGFITGSIPKDSPSLYVNCLIYFKAGHKPASVSIAPGKSFSYKVTDIKVMGITIIDQAKKRELASYAYRSLPSLTAVPTGGDSK